MDESVYEMMTVESKAYPIFARHLDDEFGKDQWKLMPGQVQANVPGRGDAICVGGPGKWREVEAKLDRTKHPNLFLEAHHVWPNGKKSDGWMIGSKASELWYFWLSQGLLLKVPMARLQTWYQGESGNLRLVQQKANRQTADTYGNLVHRDVIRDVIPGTISVPFDNREWLKDDADRRTETANA